MSLKPFKVFRPDIPCTVSSSHKLRREHKTEASPRKSFQTSTGLLEVQTDEDERFLPQDPFEDRHHVLQPKSNRREIECYLQSGEMFDIR